VLQTTLTMFTFGVNMVDVVCNTHKFALAFAMLKIRMQIA